MSGEPLSEGEARLRFMADAMPQMIFTIRGNGVMEYCNKQWSEYSGVPVEVLLSDVHKLVELVHPEDRKRSLGVWSASFKAGKPVEHQYRLRRADGVYRWHICRIRPMKGPDGKAELWVGSCTDIEDMQQAAIKRHELEMKTQQLDAQRAELLALNQAKDEFVSLVSHQLRTPATGVKQYISMVLQDFAGPLNAEQRAFLQTAYDSNDRQINIINDLLQVARIDAGKIVLTPRRVNVARLLKAIVSEHVGPVAEQQQRLVLRVPEQPIFASIDAQRFRTVLDTIIDNASKYTPPGKSITVKAAVTASGKTLEVAVADQGSGLSPAEVSKIFQKFSRLENPLTKRVDGSGLGLYWAKKLVTLHGGEIVVRSRKGRGTTFTVILPGRVLKSS